MTIKTFCDGCDKEISDGRRNTVSILVTVPAGASEPKRLPNVDLCESCFNQFRFHSWPTTWPRAVEPKSAA